MVLAPLLQGHEGAQGSPGPTAGFMVRTESKLGHKHVWAQPV
jgi:hypothetical protein